MSLNINSFANYLNGNYILICTSNSVEKSAVNELLLYKQDLKIDISSRGCYIGLYNGLIIIHLSGDCGHSQEYSISHLIINFIKKYNKISPALLCLVGFCWGSPNKTKIRDIILSNHVISINNKKQEKSILSYRDSEYLSNIKIPSHIEDKLKKTIHNIKIGKITSMETLLSNTQERDNILAKLPDILGGEMEAFGFIPIIQSDNIPWLILKTVSDFGDDNVTRTEQNTAAQTSAASIESILLILQKESIINLLPCNESDTLHYSLVGKDIKITAKDFTQSTLNDYLNDTISHIISHNLQFYYPNSIDKTTFKKYFLDLILEIIQNGFRHAGCENITVRFNENSIKIIEDKTPYDLNMLTGNKGGHQAWCRVKEQFLEKKLINYNFSLTKKNPTHHFELIEFTSNMKKLHLDCKGEMQGGKVISGWKGTGVLSYPTSCDSIIIDDRKIVMTSRLIALKNELEILLDSGKTIYVFVRDKEDEKKYDLLKSKYDNIFTIIEGYDI
ncbi:TPA: hypothetical protein ACXJEZ_002665 [Providencia rettgeri]|uniref:phosphorylase family protein n=5 Tax=Providencia TaxID=586 RepID=UPI00234AECC3|nr:hypothetical protein [Providencia sp. PROV124]